MADFLGTVHHEFTFTVEEGIDALYDLIWHIESYEQVGGRGWAWLQHEEDVQPSWRDLHSGACSRGNIAGWRSKHAQACGGF